MRLYTLNVKSLIVVLLVHTSSALAAEPLAANCSAKSGDKVTPLLELYTSEGCSSCPPADKWLSSLPANPKQFVPLAFHVDYWDYIGWKDRFSKAQYSDRQRKTAAFNHAGFVYTPQFVFNGRDFKGWDNSRLNSFIKKQPPAQVNVALEAIDNEAGDITLKATANTTNVNLAKNTDVFIALYENKLVSEVKAGENNGRELKHDYVVRELFGAYQMNNQNDFSKNFTLDAAWKNKEAGAVIFVQDSTNGQILQSLQLAFCK
jgi:hypothetical protein